MEPHRIERTSLINPRPAVWSGGKWKVHILLARGGDILLARVSQGPAVSCDRRECNLVSKSVRNPN